MDGIVNSFGEIGDYRSPRPELRRIDPRLAEIHLNASPRRMTDESLGPAGRRAAPGNEDVAGNELHRRIPKVAAPAARVHLDCAPDRRDTCSTG